MVYSFVESKHYANTEATAALLILPTALLLLGLICMCARCITRNSDSNLDMMGNIKRQTLEDNQALP